LRLVFFLFEIIPAFFSLKSTKMSSSSSTDANVMVSNTPIKSRRVHQTGKRRRISNEHSPITKLSLDELSVDEAKLLLKDAETVLENDELVRLADNELQEDYDKQLKELALQMKQEDWLLNAKENWNGICKQIF